MSGSMNIPAMQRVLMEFERQSSAMDMKEEMMSDAVDDVMDVRFPSPSLRPVLVC
jgi:charged multivesicular body protein 2A